MNNEIVIQKGHVVNYGSTISGDLRLTGAKMVEFGAALETGVYQLQRRPVGKDRGRLSTSSRIMPLRLA